MTLTADLARRPDSSSSAGLEVGDVVEASWAASGRPRVLLPSLAAKSCCARCGRYGRVHPAKKVVSSTFCGHSEWSNPDGHGLCGPCSWSYRDRALRTRAHHVLLEPARLRPLSRSQLLYVLSRALGPSEALIVPQQGRKHLLPVARWGMVTLDDTAIPWTIQDAELLEVVATFRKQGVGEQALARSAPPWGLVGRVNPEDKMQTLREWSRLDAWRTGRRLWLDLAVIATRATWGLDPCWWTRG